MNPLITTVRGEVNLLYPWAAQSWMLTLQRSRIPPQVRSGVDQTEATLLANDANKAA